MNKKFQSKNRSTESVHHLESQPARDDKALILPIGLIKVGSNVRSELLNIPELTASIKIHGLLQPLVLAKSADGHLELVAGRRRFEAARAAGLKEVPVRIVGADENQIKTIRLIENLQREELSPTEEIAAVADLAAVFDGNQDQLAQALGKNKSYVSRCLKTAKVMTALGPAVAAPQLTKTMLFEIADAADPKAALLAVNSGKITTTKEVRKPSGPIGGGRFVAGALQFRENANNGSFSLRINFDPERTPSQSRIEIIQRLELLLKKLKE